jgi:hypothetical protein
MIDKMTEEQEAKMEVYIEEWLKICLSTERFTIGEARDIVRDFYADVLEMNLPETLIITDSPKSAWDAVCEYKLADGESKEFIYPYTVGNMNSGYFSFYEFCEKGLGVSGYTPKWRSYLNTVKFGIFFCFDDICIVSQKPISIAMVNGLLHNPNGPSISYADGFEVYSLNGIKVTKELVMTPASELSTDLVLKEKNAEIRREMVRKIGIERVIDKLGANVVDKWEEYELLDMPKIEGMISKAKWLKMKNPSIGTYHIEGVPFEMKTCQEALSWRIGGIKWEPSQLT